MMREARLSFLLLQLFTGFVLLGFIVLFVYFSFIPPRKRQLFKKVSSVPSCWGPCSIPRCGYFSLTYESHPQIQKNLDWPSQSFLLRGKGNINYLFYDGHFTSKRPTFSIEKALNFTKSHHHLNPGSLSREAYCLEPTVAADGGSCSPAWSPCAVVHILCSFTSQAPLLSCQATQQVPSKLAGPTLSWPAQWPGQVL